MKRQKVRYASTTVRHRKNLQRTLNTFSEQYNFITMKPTPIGTYNFTYYMDDDIGYENLIYRKSLVRNNLKTTTSLLKANAQMFEHKKYQPYIEKIISRTEKYIQAENGETVVINYFFDEDKKDDMINHFHHHLEKLSGKDLTEHFVKKLYTSLKNRASFPIIYDDKHQTSKTNIIKPEKYIQEIIKDYYRDYNEYEWILEEDFSYWRSEASRLGDENSVNNEVAETIHAWNRYINELQAEKIDERFYESIDFLGAMIKNFYTEEPLLEFEEDGIRSEIVFDEGFHDFMYDEDYFDGNKLSHFIELKPDKKHQDIKYLGNIYLGLNTNIPKDIQEKIFNLCYFEKRKSIFDF